MTGARSDILDVLNASDLFVFPTLHENFSNSLLEAGVAGKAVIATEVGGNPEIIRHNTTGLLVPPNQSEDLADQIHLLVSNPQLRLSLGECLRDHVNKNFSLDSIVPQYDRLYSDLLDGRR
jgi:glycosyltransferase involved in cell wall biosynthesis